MPFRNAQLVLEDGRRFPGRRFGAPGGAGGEIVFNTSMAGYQEILTDPSYAGQIVCMTSPHQGNYGIAREDMESHRPFLSGFVVREHSPWASNYRATETLDAYLARCGIVGLDEVDTRALTRHLRDRGAMRAVIADHDAEERTLRAALDRVPPMEGADHVRAVTTPETSAWAEGRNSPLSPVFDAPRATPGAAARHVVAVDFGIKHHILRCLVEVGFRVTRVPADIDAAELLALAPDGVFLSNGPGDPAALPDARRLVERLLGRVPIFGICLGHQIMGLAFGARTYKLRFGHHGANHPVQELATGAIAITAQNHGFAVDADSLPADVEVSHVNLNDRTVEGLRHRSLPAFSVQYHPEASPGPHDALGLFERFAALVEAAPAAR